MINLIVAFDPDGTIGVNNNLPWNIKEDLRLFRKLTINNIVIMGRKTYESIGNPLDSRINIVVTSKEIFGNLYTFPSVEASLKYANKININKEIFIIGGKTIYDYCLNNNFIDRMFVSKIKKKYHGDTKFTEFKEYEWNAELKEQYEEFDLWIYTKKLKTFY